MNLGVGTICAHIYHEGQWWSYEPFVLEMNVWADLFDSLVLAAPLDSGPPPPFWAPYADSAKITVVPFRRDRGRGLDQPVTTPWEIPALVGALLRVLRRTDAFHLRSPGNIGLIASLLVPLVQRRRCAKYAGQWPDYPGEARSYRLQKAILRSRWWGAPTTVYGRWPGQPAHIRPFFTSVLTAAQMDRARQAMRVRQPGDVPQVLFVGRLSAAKNVDVLLRAVAALRAAGIALHCTLVGDGPERAALERLCAELDLSDCVRFAGGLPFVAVLEYYAAADILVLASETEGWPKALAEGMAFGLVCIGSARGLVPQMLADGRGLLVPPGDVAALTAALRGVATDRTAYGPMRQAAATWGQGYALESLRAAQADLLTAAWGVPLHSVIGAPVAREAGP